MTAWPSGARELVTAARVARLATGDRFGVPHAVPICFAILGDRLYSVVDAKPKRRPLALKRLRNLAENPHAAVIVDHYEEDWANLAYVLLRGSASVVDDEREYEAAVHALRDKYSQYVRMTLVPASNPLIRVHVERVHYWCAAARQ